MIKYEEFKKRLDDKGVPSSLINIVMEELIRGIDVEIKNVEFELQTGLFTIKNSKSNSSNSRCDYIIEKDGKEFDEMKYITNIKVSDFDVRDCEPPEITLTIIPFDLIEKVKAEKFREK